MLVLLCLWLRVFFFEDRALFLIFLGLGAVFGGILLFPLSRKSTFYLEVAGALL